jgi:hypothetical protein
MVLIPKLYLVHIHSRSLEQSLTRILEADEDMSLNSLRLIKIIKIISITTSTKLVFSRWPYVILNGAATTIFWIIFNVFVSCFSFLQ